MPRVSLGMPVYNGEPYLALALDSILGQTYEDYEVIISDNGSSDRTEEICREYGERDARIHYERAATNLGAARNYNRVFELSKGAYFKWAAHDDLLAPTYLSRCVSAFDAAPRDVVLCCPRTTEIDAEGRVIGTAHDRMNVPSSDVEVRLRYILASLKKCNVIFGLIRREALAATRLIGNYFASDVTLIVELCLLGRFLELPEPLFLRRMHSGCSRKANQDHKSVTAWFDPSNRSKDDMRLSRLMVENCRSIRRSQLRRWDKAMCYAALLEEWPARYWRQMGGELKMALRRRFYVAGAHVLRKNSREPQRARETGSD